MDLAHGGSGGIIPTGGPAKTVKYDQRKRHSPATCDGLSVSRHINDGESSQEETFNMLLISLDPEMSEDVT